jgi:NTE family protein
MPSGPGQPERKPAASHASRSIVLGGGGLTGIAWEVGLLKGLADGGADLGAADTIFGTSAGAFAGAYLASGRLDEFFGRQFSPDVVEIPAAMSQETIEGWGAAIAAGAGDPKVIGRALGRMALGASTVPAAARAAVVRSRLAGLEWPGGKLKLTAIDAETGELCLLHSSGAIPLTTAAAASGALPGLWPVVEANGRRWIDGGSVSPVNAWLGEGYDAVLVIAPAPEGMPGLPGVDQDVAHLRGAGSQVIVVVPDLPSKQAIGDNPFDPAKRAAVAEAGRKQGQLAVAEVAAAWC